jgi:hypothetical protein
MTDVEHIGRYSLFTKTDPVCSQKPDPVSVQNRSRSATLDWRIVSLIMKTFVWESRWDFAGTRGSARRFYVSINAVLWSRNFLFPLRLRLSKSFSSGSDISFELPFITGFLLKSGFFMFSYERILTLFTCWKLYKINFDFHLLIKLTRSRSRNFDIPAPAKSSGSLQLRLLAAPAPQHWINEIHQQGPFFPGLWNRKIWRLFQFWHYFWLRYRLRFMF